MTQRVAPPSSPADPASAPSPESAPESAPEPEGVSGAARGESLRKERVLHTRIPAVLEHELKRFADSLRIPVSNLVRTILEDAVTVADRATGLVEAELPAAARLAGGKRESLLAKLKPRSGLEGVYAFQPVVLGQPALCAGCAAPLASGADAWLGLRDGQGPKVFACDACLPKLEAEPSPAGG